MDNKDLVVSALNEAFINGDVNAVEKYWDQGFVNHNPKVGGGIEELKSALMASTFDYEIGAVFTDGEFVVVHARVDGWAPQPQVVVDLFRVKEGKIAEHWDVIQVEVPTDQTAGKTPMWPAG